MQQAIGDARGRDGDVDRVLDAVHRRRRKRQRRIADAGAGAIAEPKAAARQADLAERRPASGPSSRIGLMFTTSTPARANSAIQPRVECDAQPPLLTSVFFGLAPPNSTINLECRAIEDHDVSGPTTDCGLPTICGRNAS